MTRFLLTLERAVELIEWVYYKNNSHGCIAVPKIPSFSILAIAKAILKSRNLSENIEIIGQRLGEKIHEEMISDTEWMKTLDEGDNYLITDTILNSETKSFNSENSLMSDSLVFEFLKSSGVL
jgi:FlaA1/EpsC-like NDP-sugar epimerase